jgi:hypothetical protein
MAAWSDQPPQVSSNVQQLKIIASLDDLLALPADRRVNGFAMRTRVQLELAGMPRSPQIHAQQRLNRLQMRCGCLAGAVSLLLTLALGAPYMYLNSAGIGWRVVPFAAGLVVAALFIGFAAKILTLAATRWQFARECRVQHQALAYLLEDTQGFR